MTQVATTTQNLSNFLKGDAIKARFEELLGKNASSFLSSVLALANNPRMKDKFDRCSRESVYISAMTAATLNLQVNPSLGFAYLIPYGSECSFQIGYKGLIQLALRTGLYKSIGACPVYDGQLVEVNPLFGNTYDWTVEPEGSPIGYAAAIELVGGFKKEVYWPIAKIKAHRAKFSKAKDSPWDSDFDSMASKTVLKQVLKFGPMSTEMQRAVVMDNAKLSMNDEGEIVADDYAEEADVVVGIDWQGIGDRLEAVATKLKPFDYQNGLAVIADKDEAAVPVLMKTIEAAEKA